MAKIGVYVTISLEANEIIQKMRSKDHKFNFSKWLDQKIKEAVFNDE